MRTTGKEKGRIPSGIGPSSVLRATVMTSGVLSDPGRHPHSIRAQFVVFFNQEVDDRLGVCEPLPKFCGRIAENIRTGAGGNAAPAGRTGARLGSGTAGLGKHRLGARGGGFVQRGSGGVALHGGSPVVENNDALVHLCQGGGTTGGGTTGLITCLRSLKPGIMIHPCLDPPNQADMAWDRALRFFCVSVPTVKHYELLRHWKSSRIMLIEFMVRFLPTPKSLRDIADTVVAGGDYTFAMKEFIDNVIRDLRSKGARRSDATLPVGAEFFVDEPPVIEKPIHRVHLAGMAEYLANLSGQPTPAWCLRSEFFLDEPLIFGGSAAARETSIAETPGAFSKRQLFCGRSLAKLFALLDA